MSALCGLPYSPFDVKLKPRLGRSLQLVQELVGHTSYINSVCFNEDGTLLYSGDCLGRLCVWDVYVTNSLPSRGKMTEVFFSVTTNLKYF